MEKPIISVIMPCYNVPEKYFIEALQSVRDQTYKSFEIIVIDDGSENEYHEILVKYVTAQNERLITIKNSGVSEARNIGIDAAKGDWICFLDADDWLTKNFLERAVQFQQLTQVDFVIGGVQYCKERICSQNNTSENPVFQVYDREKINLLIPHLIGSTNLIVFSDGYISRGPIARLIKRELAKEIKFDKNLSMGEDLVWNQKVLKRVNNVCVVKETWYYYWNNCDSKTHKQNDDVFYEIEKQIHALWRILDTDNEMTYRSFIEHHFEEMHTCWNICLRHLREKEKKKYHELTKYIYHSKIWSTMCCSKTYNISTRNRKLIIFSCRLKLYFFLLAIKDELKHTKE